MKHSKTFYKKTSCIFIREIYSIIRGNREISVTEYTTFKQRYISFINLLLLFKTKLKCNKIKVLTLNKKTHI